MAQTFKSEVKVDGKLGVSNLPSGSVNYTIADRLHVYNYGSGGIRIQSDVTPVPGAVDAHIRFFTGSIDIGKISANINNGLQFYDGGSHVVTMDGGNTRVGIGETSPDETLHVRDTNATIKVEANSNYTPAIELSHGTELAKIYANTNSTLKISEKGTDVLSIDGTSGVDVLVGDLEVQNGGLIVAENASSQGNDTVIAASFKSNGGRTFIQTIPEVGLLPSNYTYSGIQLCTNSTGTQGVGMYGNANPGGRFAYFMTFSNGPYSEDLYAGFGIHAYSQDSFFITGSKDFYVNSDTLYVDASADRVGINDATPSYALDVTGTIRATADVIAYSDIRLKENIKTIDSALNKVLKIRGVEFNKIGESKKSIGVIAQEIEKILPEVVDTDVEGMKSVSYGNIVGLLIEAIKEQQLQIEELKK